MDAKSGIYRLEIIAIDFSGREGAIGSDVEGRGYEREGDHVVFEIDDSKQMDEAVLKLMGIEVEDAGVDNNVSNKRTVGIAIGSALACVFVVGEREKM